MSKILYSKDDAIQKGKQYLEENQMMNPKYMRELENTMTYIFDVLHHSCYFLCVNKNKTFDLYKLENKTSPPVFKKAFAENIRRGLFQKTLKQNQRQHIINTASNPFRVMQCIVKPIRDDSTFSKEYATFLSNLKNLTPGLFVLNLTDAVILREDKKMPSNILGEVSLSSLGISNDFLPILSLSGQKKYVDIPVPNYDDIAFAISDKMPVFETQWSKKKARAVFRGGPTGCGVIPETNSRLKLATLPATPDLDVGLVSGSEFANTIDTKSVRIDPKYGLGMLNTGIKPVKKMTMLEQSRNKYLIHIDGNVNAYRLLTTMLTGSLILRVESEYTSWLDGILISGQHYLSIRADLSNLMETIRWCKEHDDECEQIAKASLEIAGRIADKTFIETYFENVLRLTQPKTKSKSSSNSNKSQKIKVGKRCPNGYRADKKDKTICRKNKN